MVPFVVPDILKLQPAPADFPDPDSTAIWSDAAVWVPWALWQAYGDRAVLERQYDSMTAHVRRVETLLSPTGLWDTSFQFGDWLDPDAPPDAPAEAKADTGVVATASFHRSARDRRGDGRAARARGRRGRVRGPGATHPRRLQRALRRRRRRGAVRLHDRVHAGDRLRAPRRGDRGRRRQAARPARGRERLPGVDRVRRARRTSPTRSPGPDTSTTPTGCCWSGSARPGCTP